MTSEPGRKSPGELLREKGQLADDIVAVRIDGRIVDLHSPVDANVVMTPIRIGDQAGLEVIRHSAAHVMADAVQRLFPGTQVTIGPAIESGFYYDFYRGQSFSEEDLARIEKLANEIIAADLPFVRKEIAMDEAIKLFESKGEKCKGEI